MEESSNKNHSPPPTHSPWLGSLTLFQDLYPPLDPRALGPKPGDFSHKNQGTRYCSSKLPSLHNLTRPWSFFRGASWAWNLLGTSVILRFNEFWMKTMKQTTSSMCVGMNILYLDGMGLDLFQISAWELVWLWVISTSDSGILLLESHVGKFNLQWCTWLIR